jgi:hypothetical protein
MGTSIAIFIKLGTRHLATKSLGNITGSESANTEITTLGDSVFITWW